MYRKPDYGIDSPTIVVFQVPASGIAFVLAFACLREWRWIGLAMGAYFLSGALHMVHYSKYGKLKLRNRLLHRISWRGDERVLDVGCGKGLLLVGAAGRLTSGKATGVDLWLRHALSGNGPDAVLRNAEIEGVADRVDVNRGDVRHLPFDDASFDVVVSNFVLHEMQNQSDREKMVREIVRVLKPGGRLALIDFIFTRNAWKCCEAPAPMRRGYGLTAFHFGQAFSSLSARSSFMR